MQEKQPKRNPIARDLRTPKYKKRVVQSRKHYDRKKEKLHVRRNIRCE